MMLMRTCSLLLVCPLFCVVENAAAEDSKLSIIQLKVGATMCSLSTWRQIAENRATSRFETDRELTKALNIEWGELENRCTRIEPDKSGSVVITGRSLELEDFGKLFELQDGRYVWDDDVED